MPTSQPRTSLAFSARRTGPTHAIPCPPIDHPARPQAVPVRSALPRATTRPDPGHAKRLPRPPLPLSSPTTYQSDARHARPCDQPFRVHAFLASPSRRAFPSPSVPVRAAPTSLRAPSRAATTIPALPCPPSASLHDYPVRLWSAQRDYPCPALSTRPTARTFAGHPSPTSHATLWPGRRATLPTCLVIASPRRNSPRLSDRPVQPWSTQRDYPCRPAPYLSSPCLPFRLWLT
jgi:hypothetical protein